MTKGLSWAGAVVVISYLYTSTSTPPIFTGSGSFSMPACMPSTATFAEANFIIPSIA